MLNFTEGAVYFLDELHSKNRSANARRRKLCSLSNCTSDSNCCHPLVSAVTVCRGTAVDPRSGSRPKGVPPGSASCQQYLVRSSLKMHSSSHGSPWDSRGPPSFFPRGRPGKNLQGHSRPCEIPPGPSRGPKGSANRSKSESETKDLHDFVCPLSRCNPLSRCVRCTQ
jgi:hypothetical protein